MKLTDARLRNTTEPGKYFDGAGLFLLVTGGGGRYWRLKYRHIGKEKLLALGVYPKVGLKEARERRDEAKRSLGRQEDPGQVKKDARSQAIAEALNSFQAIALEWHDAHRKRWADKTISKTLRYLQSDVFPAIGKRPISAVTHRELLAMLQKVEARGASYTATRIREMCGQIFRFAIVTDRAKTNPAADLAGFIVTPTVRHRPALTNRREFGEFLVALREYKGADLLTMLATRFALLTFVRSQEMRFAKWIEIDLTAKEWRIPSERMKMGKGLNQAHIVPLSKAAIDVLRELQPLTGYSDKIFPQTGSRKCMSDSTIGRMLIRMGYQGQQTMHGFRASARSLLSERGWNESALERQLDHAERSKVVAAYARSQHLDERRKIMDDWGALVCSLESSDSVVPFPAMAA